MAPAPVVQQPEHRKAGRPAEVIGADRVLTPHTPRGDSAGKGDLVLLQFVGIVSALPFLLTKNE